MEPKEGSKLVSLGSEELVSRHVELVVTRGDWQDLHNLARRHPKIAVDWLQNQANHLAFFGKLMSCYPIGEALPRKGDHRCLFS